MPNNFIPNSIATVIYNITHIYMLTEEELEAWERWREWGEGGGKSGGDGGRNEEEKKRGKIKLKKSFKVSQDIWNIIYYVCIVWIIFTLIQVTLIHGSNIPDSYAILFFTASDFIFTTRHIHSWASFLLWLSHFILLVIALHSSPAAYRISSDLSGRTHLLVSYLFTFPYISWGSTGKRSGVGCHFLLQWNAFCQNS